MNTPSQADRDRLLELMADRALFGLDNGEQSELANLQPLVCLLYTSPSPRDATLSRMPSSA